MCAASPNLPFLAAKAAYASTPDAMRTSVHKASQLCSYPACGHNARSKSWYMDNPPTQPRMRQGWWRARTHDASKSSATVGPSDRAAGGGARRTIAPAPSLRGQCQRAGPEVARRHPAKAEGVRRSPIVCPGRACPGLLRGRARTGLLRGRARTGLLRGRRRPCASAERTSRPHASEPSGKLSSAARP
jgi:hypothetical protein